VIGLSHNLVDTLLHDIPSTPTLPSTLEAPLTQHTLNTTWSYFLSVGRTLPSTPTLPELLIFEFGPEQANAELTTINEWRSRGNEVWVVLHTETHRCDLAMTLSQALEASQRFTREEVVIFYYPPFT